MSHVKLLKYNDVKQQETVYIKRFQASFLWMLVLLSCQQEFMLYFMKLQFVFLWFIVAFKFSACTALFWFLCLNSRIITLVVSRRVVGKVENFGRFKPEYCTD